MEDKQNSEGVVQADKAIQAIERPRRQSNPKIKEEEELALREMISGIVPEWKEAKDNKGEERDYSSDETIDGRVDELGENTDENVDRKEERTQSQRAMKMGPQRNNV
eukprot:6202101-Pleurochrysis_carterae.AAC.4